MLDLHAAGRKVADRARDLGVSEQTIHPWRQIEHVTVFEPWDEAFIDADGGRVRIHGRGGTSFIPPFTWVEQQAESGEAAPDALIYLTDGFGPFPTEPPDFPVLWVLSADGADDAVDPFGAVIRLPRRV